MISFMVTVFSTIITASNIKVNSNKINLTAKEDSNSKMVDNTKARMKITRDTDMARWPTQMKVSTKDNGSKTKDKEKEHSIFLMKANILEVFRMINTKDMVFLLIKMANLIEVFGAKVKKTEKWSIPSTEKPKPRNGNLT